MGTLSLGTVGVLSAEGGGFVAGGATVLATATGGITNAPSTEVLNTMHNVKPWTSATVTDEDGEVIALQDVVNRPFANWRNW
jgi:hypothetical protein